MKSLSKLTKLLSVQDRKGIVRLNDMPNIVLLFVIIGIFLAIGALIIAEIADQPSINPNDNNGSVQFNATQDTLEGIGTISSFVPIIGVVVAAAVILGVVFLIRA